MKYNIAMTTKQNLERLFKVCTKANNESIQAREDVATTNNNLAEAQAETDEIILDQEERLILLEVGE